MYPLLLIIIGGFLCSLSCFSHRYSQHLLFVAEEHLGKWEHANEYKERNASKSNGTV